MLAPFTVLAAASPLLAPDRLAALPEPARETWEAYLRTSREHAESDREAMARELKAAEQSTWTPASAGPAFAEEYGGEASLPLADALVSFQTPSGGWSKNLDLARGPRRKGESYSADKGWRWIGTFDNAATIGPLRFLAAAHRVHGRAPHHRAFLAGVDYVLRAQFPNGGWPQVYPLEGGYHDAATYNDGVIVENLRFLRDLARGDLGPIDSDRRSRAAASVARGVDAVLAMQVVVEGRPTVWCAQHDPLTLVPIKARPYEHPSLSGLESAALVDFLMTVADEAALPRVEAAVHAAAEWLRANAIYGYEYPEDRERITRPGAGPLWARFYETSSGRPIFSNRDGAVRYEWRELEDERRRGYAWYSDAAAATLRRYDDWIRRHPLPRRD